jgi:N-acetylglucosamine-6-sulfatase
MMAVDDLIGNVISELQATGEMADTLLVFTSDNGFLLGEHRLTKKHQAFEEAIRVPLYVSGPGVAVQRTATQRVVNTDLAPTILELAQAPAGLPGDGRSLAPILADPGFAPWRSYFLIEHAQVSDSPVTEYAAVRSDQHLWVEYADGQRELYDFTTDLPQLTSQHANHAYNSVKTTLRQKLQVLRSCAGNGCWQ